LDDENVTRSSTNRPGMKASQPLPYPLPSEKIEPNLETIQLNVRDNLETAEPKPRDNLEKTPFKPRDNLEIEPISSSKRLADPHDSTQYGGGVPSLEAIREKLEITQRQPRENLETTQRQPRENLETTFRRTGRVTGQLREEPRDQPRENLEISSRKPSDINRFSTLVGGQRRVTLYFYNETVRVRDRITDAMTSGHLAEVCQTTVPNIQNTIKELIKKGIVIRVEFKNGRGGWTRYELSDDIFQQIHTMESNGKLRDILEKTQRQPGDKPGDKPRDAPPSSSISSSLNELNTNTRSDTETPTRQSKELPTEWLQVVWSEETKKIGFGLNELKQWWQRNYCSPQEAQESIRHFEFQRKNSSPDHPINKNPLNYLMGTMHRSKYFLAPQGYVSPEDEFLQKKLQQQQAALNQKRQLEDHHFNIVFEEYFDTLSAKQIRLLSPQISTPEGSKAIIHSKFREKYWHEIRDSFKNRTNLDVGRFTLDVETRVLPENNTSGPPQDTQHTYQESAEGKTLSLKIDQLRRLHANDPSSQTQESLRKLEDQLRQIETFSDPYTAEEIRAITEKQFGPGA
jgi:hypothetical protein